MTIEGIIIDNDATSNSMTCRRAADLTAREWLVAGELTI